MAGVSNRKKKSENKLENHDPTNSRVRQGLWMGAVSSDRDHRDLIDIEGIYLLMPGLNACWYGFRTCEEAAEWAKKTPGDWLVYENTAETIASRKVGRCGP